MMRHASTHLRLFARQATFIQRIQASANDCLMPVAVSTAAERGGQQSLQLRRSLTKRAPLIHSLCRSPHTGSGTNFEGSDCPTL